MEQVVQKSQYVVANTIYISNSVSSFAILLCLNMAKLN